jgi:hypothetical protein
MQTLNIPIGPEGPLVDVLIGLAATAVQTLRSQGRPVPSPVTARGLIDTGAEVSCADPQLLAPLVSAGLQVGRYVFANAPALGGVNAAEYFVSLTVVHSSGNARANLVLRNQELVEQPVGQLSYQVLIGRAVLDRTLHVHNGPAQQFTLAY